MDRRTFYMAAVSTTAKIASPLNLSNLLHQGENWKSFRREWKFYELAAGIHKKAQEVRVASLLNVVGVLTLIVTGSTTKIHRCLLCSPFEKIPRREHHD